MTIEELRTWLEEQRDTLKAYLDALPPRGNTILDLLAPSAVEETLKRGRLLSLEAVIDHIDTRADAAQEEPNDDHR